MSREPQFISEVNRLEQFWGGECGDASVYRNAEAHEKRGQFWQTILAEGQVGNALEVRVGIYASVA